MNLERIKEYCSKSESYEKIRFFNENLYFLSHTLVTFETSSKHYLSIYLLHKLVSRY